MILRTFTGGPFQENGYLAVSEESGAAVIVDPGGGTPAMLAYLQSEELTPEAIVLTHAHIDHVDGIPALRAAYPGIPVHLHPLDLPLYRQAPAQGAMFGVAVPELPTPDVEIVPGEVLEFAPDLRFEVRFAPGHAPGHVILVHAEAGIALVGDVIFAGSIGRTDLPGGDFRTLMTSIREQVMTLPDETRLFNGHGPDTTVARERSSNPFVLGLVGE
jgi:glyoxylase-like metal-dependent hydrolase (beta-lactamase superfamily II)